MSDAIHAGGCLCGAVRYAARGPATHRCYCHCASCRRAVGATPVAWTTFAADGFALTRGALAEIASSAQATRGFCAACGTSLTYVHAARPGAIDVTTATFDAPEALRPEYHIWVSDRVDWAPLADGLPQYPGWRTGG